jgi:uncharacterized protein YecT (DUF1311 family)
MSRLAVFSALLAVGLNVACTPPADKQKAPETPPAAQGPAAHVTDGWGLPAFADADPASDRPRIEACLVKAEAEQADSALCIDVVSRPCLQLDTNLSTAGMVGCLSREGDVWNALLNARLAQVEAAASPAFLKTFRAASATWKRATEENCALFSAFHEGGTMAAPMGASCMSDAAARRYLFLGAFEPPKE